MTKEKKAQIEYDKKVNAHIEKYIKDESLTIEDLQAIIKRTEAKNKNRLKAINTDLEFIRITQKLIEEKKRLQIHITISKN